MENWISKSLWKTVKNKPMRYSRELEVPHDTFCSLLEKQEKVMAASDWDRKQTGKVPVVEAALVKGLKMHARPLLSNNTETWKPF